MGRGLGAEDCQPRGGLFAPLVNRSVLESAHDDLDGNAILRDREFARQRADHHARQIERRRYFFAPGALVFLEMIEHPDANGECAVFLDDVRVQAGEAALGNVLGKIHGSAGFMVEVLGARAGLRRSRQAERQKRQADGHGHEANDPQGLRGLGHRGAHRAAP